ncbi:hypothetical protein E2542_SST13420 [Spatholobus suberectus]|nr:hypothetical protein E2542_SST13420 [Spatholobus suberectus]
MDWKRPRKLNLNAPLLSTRRLGCSIVADASCSSNSVGAGQNTSERVPFSWEKAPGKPKDTERSDNTQDGGTPRLRLPPHHPFPPKEAAKADVDVDDGDDAFHDQGDGSCDGNDNQDDVFSDAVDVFSLSEALDIIQRKSENAHSENNDSYPECYISGSARHSYASSPKGCGLELLFPWRVKHKLCAIESPVLPCSTNMHKHQRSSKQKKHRSSAYIPCTNGRDI